MSKASHCDECRFFNPWRAAIPAPSNLCQNGHRPRFYLPRNPLDQDYGWKRKCPDYKAKEDE